MSKSSLLSHFRRHIYHLYLLPQIQGLAIAVDQCFAVLDRLAPLMSAASAEAGAEDAKLDSECQCCWVHLN